ncbi:MAG: hypothetical protein IJ899_21450 [Blautia sp.]|nr:hypothetical protein [Blautia sp.]
MEKWTREELEELFQKANQKAKEDEEFRKEAKQDIKAALEKLAGRELPEGFQLEMIASGALDDEAAEKAAGGQSENCIIDINFPKYEGCPDLCGAWGCPTYGHVYFCPPQICATHVAPAPCSADICGFDICGAVICAAHA